MEKILIFSTALIVFVLWFYKRITRNHDYFEKQGIVFEKPLPMVGNIWPLITKKEGMIQFIERYYNTYKNEK